VINVSGTVTFQVYVISSKLLHCTDVIHITEFRVQHSIDKQSVYK
jgi:hypothetical protein